MTVFNCTRYTSSNEVREITNCEQMSTPKTDACGLVEGAARHSPGETESCNSAGNRTRYIPSASLEHYYFFSLFGSNLCIEVCFVVPSSERS
jgi:hypothetical protein